MEEKSRVLQSGEEVGMLTEKNINTGQKVPMEKVTCKNLKRSTSTKLHRAFTSPRVMGALDLVDG
jgi:hypothetical protein